MRYVVLAMLLLSAVAAEPCAPWWRSLYPANRGWPKCADDYCPKPPPCPASWRYCGSDDYCRKSQPCTTPWRYCAPDDYCRKPATFHLPPCNSDR